MGKTSKDLLQLEHSDPSSSKESALLVCRKGSKSCQQKPKMGESLMTPLPRSQVIGKVRDFLGVISEANKNLEVKAKDKPEDYDIEILTGNETEYIKMDLMLGLADLYTPDAVAAAEVAMAGNQSVANLSTSTSSTEPESSSADDEDDDEESKDEDENKNAGSQQVDSARDGSGSCQKKKRRKIIELS